MIRADVTWRCVKTKQEKREEGKRKGGNLVLDASSEFAGMMDRFHACPLSSFSFPSFFFVFLFFLLPSSPPDALFGPFPPRLIHTFGRMNFVDLAVFVSLI